jgi:anti-sigma regulatory factor (Ser/Thr protein kinase)
MAAPIPEPARSVSLRLAFEPEPSGARAVAVAIRNFLAEHGVPAAELFGYELCTAEACNNAIEYGEGLGSRRNPVVVAQLTPSQIELRVIDHTPGFVLPERIEPPPPLDERGRGLFLIQTVMDEMRYVRGPRENVLIMLKRRFGAMRWGDGRAEGDPDAAGRRANGTGAQDPVDLSAGHEGARDNLTAASRG